MTKVQQYMNVNPTYVFFFFLHIILSDQTPTPTRFLQNCEEVGLFKEIEEEFLQAQEEEKSKQVHFTENYT